MASILIGILIVPCFSSWINMTTTMSSSEAFAWEIITAIQTMPEEQKAGYTTYLDDIYGEGKTQEALDINGDTNIWLTLTVLNAMRDLEQGKAIQKEIMNKYLMYAMENKVHFLKTKWHFISGMMGIEAPLQLGEWNYDRLERMGQYNFNDTQLRHNYYDCYPHAVDDTFLLRPWIIFLTTSALVIFHQKYKPDRQIRILKMEWFAYFTAMFYYGAFLINTQSMEFRYFYPSCMLLLLTGFSASINLFYIAFEKSHMQEKAQKYLARR